MPRQTGVRARNRNVSKVEVARQSNIVLNQKSNFGSVEDNLGKYVEFASWVIWYPDLFLDLLKPKEGGITLHSDQRIFLRCATRFFSVYGCFPRGQRKEFSKISSLGLHTRVTAFEKSGKNGERLTANTVLSDQIAKG
jgi:hypothetical protein